MSNDLTRSYMRLHTRQMSALLREAHSIGFLNLNPADRRVIALRAARDPMIQRRAADLSAFGLAAR